MKTREIHKLLHQNVVPFLRGWHAKDRYIYSAGSDSILRGIYLDGSSFSESVVFVQLFAVPLYVPAESINFLFGKRLRDPFCSERWSINLSDSEVFAKNLVAAVVNEGNEWVGRVASPKLLAQFIRDTVQWPLDIHPKQVLAFTLAYTGAFAEAESMLDDLMRETLAIVSNSPWAGVISDRARDLADMIRENPEAVDGIMSKWIYENKLRLKLPFE